MRPHSKSVVCIISRRLLTAVALIAALSLITAPLLMHGGINTGAGNSGPNPGADSFSGKITSQKVAVGSFAGVGSYDRNCVDAGNGLTNCDAGIEIQGYGVVNFNYVHDMHSLPCIKPGEKLSMRVLGEDGSAVVERLF